MDSESSLHRLRDELAPAQGQKERIRARLMERIEPSSILERARAAATPPSRARGLVWARVIESIQNARSSSLLGRLRDLLMPAEDLQQNLRFSILERLAPVAVPVPLQQRWFKWAAACVVVLLMLRLTPLLFLAAPRSSAESAVLLVPTAGSVSVLTRGLWESVAGQITLTEGGQFRTMGNGKATFLVHDDGNIRMGDVTTLTLHDVTDRPDPALESATLTLSAGRVWVQGFVPETIRPIIVATPRGDILVHEGSVSITVSDTVTVEVWDRHARIERPGQSLLLLVAGERTVLSDGPLLVKKIPAHAEEGDWVKENLTKDAVHQREIAQMQRERTMAQAGILPTSPLYPVKRVAEAVDVLLTFGEQQRVQKQLDLASTRLDEAAAILASGGTGATAQQALAEYRTTLLSVAAGSGGSVTDFLIRQQVAQDAAEVAAALPDDSLYLVKKAVLQASADLPSPAVDAQSVDGVLVLDSLGAVNEAVQAGDLAKAAEAFAAAKTYLESLKTGTGEALPPEARKEVLSVLSTVASALQSDDHALGDASTDADTLLKDVLSYLPPPPLPAVRTGITEEEAEMIAQRIHDRVFVFKQPRSRWDQLMYEMKQLHGNPDEGTILRHLYRIMPVNGLAQYVRTAIVELGKEKSSEGSR